jgi:asparagine synthase (glutamine-hydrolysing)
LPRLTEMSMGVHPGLLLAAHRFMDRLLRAASLPEEQRHFLMHAYQTDLELFEFYSPELRATLTGSSAGSRHFDHFGAIDYGDSLTRMLYVDLKTFLPDLNLIFSDKMSSAASVEVRVPFLDNEVVDFAAHLHPNLKLRRLTSKYILKKAMKGVLPREIIYRRKAGFGAPIRNWLRGDLRPMVEELLSNYSVKSRGYFDPTAVRQMLVENRNGVADHSSKIWILLTLELWCRSFLDRETSLDKPDERVNQSVITAPTVASMN